MYMYIHDSDFVRKDIIRCSQHFTSLLYDHINYLLFNQNNRLWNWRLIGIVYISSETPTCFYYCLWYFIDEFSLIVITYKRLTVSRHSGSLIKIKWPNLLRVEVFGPKRKSFSCCKPKALLLIVCNGWNNITAFTSLWDSLYIIYYNYTQALLCTMQLHVAARFIFYTV